MKLTRKPKGRFLRHRDPDAKVDKNGQPPERLELLVLAVVVDAYDSWHRVCKTYREAGLRGPDEPSVSVGIVKLTIDMTGAQPFDYEVASDKRRYAMIRSVLGKLVTKRKLVTSRGAGMRGRETICYEPGPGA